MIKFLHFADVHLGVENYGRYDAKTGFHSRLNDFIQSLSTIVDVAIEEKIDFALFCGDAYKSNNPSPTHQREFARHVYRLSKANIPLVLINGNHDNPLTYGRASALDIFQTLQIPNTHVVTEPELINLQTAKGIVRIVGIPWPTRNQYLEKDEYRDSDIKSINRKIQNRVMKTITDKVGHLDNGYPKILAAHLTVSEALFSGSENYAMIGRDPVIPTCFFTDTPFDYIALGHIHRYQNLNPDNDPPVVYPGSIERINFGEEKEDKGFCIAEIDEQGKIDYKFIPLPVRKMITIEARIGEDLDPTTVLISEIKKYDTKDAIVRVHYEISQEQERKLDFKMVDEELKGAFLVTGITRNILRKDTVSRSTLSEEMDLFSALDEYIKLNNWQSYEKELKKVAHELQQELTDLEKFPGGSQDDTR